MLEEAGIDEDMIREAREQHREQMREHKAAVRDAVESNDYEAFVEAVEGTPMADVIDSEDDFTKLVEAHSLREAGDYEGAKTIMEELGFDKGDRGPGGFGKGRHGFGKGQ